MAATAVDNHKAGSVGVVPVISLKAPPKPEGDSDSGTTTIEYKALLECPLPFRDLFALQPEQLSALNDRNVVDAALVRSFAG